MEIAITGIRDPAPADYGKIPIAFTVTAIFDVAGDDGEGGLKLSERPIELPFKQR